MKNETDSQRIESVEIKHGHWILDKHGNYACEFCGNTPYHSNMYNMNYCPNCGAKLTIERDNITTHLIWNEPTVDAEPTEEQVKEYCRKRCLVIVTSELFDKMETMWTVKHGHWEMKADPYAFFDTIPVCSVCGCTTKYRVTSKFCPNCGAKMEDPDEE